MNSDFDDFNSPDRLRIAEATPADMRTPRRIRIVQLALGTVGICVIGMPVFFLDGGSNSRLLVYGTCVAGLLLVDFSVVVLMATWRWYALARLGSGLLHVVAYQASALRNLLFGGIVQLLAMLLLWIPLLSVNAANPPEAPATGFVPFALFAAVCAAASIPWLVHGYLDVSPHDVELHEEGIMFGAFFPCRWERLQSYAVWDDEASLVSFQVRGRGPIEVFMAQVDRDELLDEMVNRFGPPSRVGGTFAAGDGPSTGGKSKLSVFN